MTETLDKKVEFDFESKDLWGDMLNAAGKALKEGKAEEFNREGVAILKKRDKSEVIGWYQFKTITLITYRRNKTAIERVTYKLDKDDRFIEHSSRELPTNSDLYKYAAELLQRAEI